MVGDTLWDEIEEVDADPDATEDSWYSEWMEEHSVKTYSSVPVDEYTELMNELVSWILKNKPDGNYSPSEIAEELTPIIPCEDDKANELYDLAEQIWTYADPWERCDYTVEDIAKEIQEDPVAVIKQLVNWLTDN